MKVATISLKSLLEDVEQNYKNALAKMQEAMEQNPDVIMLPELFTTSFYPKDLHQYAKDSESLLSKYMGEFARKNSVNIVAGSVINSIDEKIFNTSYIFDKSGKNIASYSKIHLFSPMNEDKHFSHGEDIVTFELDNKKCGIIICYDLRFPELSRALALKGVEVLFVVSSWPQSRVKQLHALCVARAIENQLFVALCNASSDVNGVKFAGQSMLINPIGDVIAKGSVDNDIAYGELDFSIINGIRERINVFQDRKESLYKKW